MPTPLLIYGAYGYTGRLVAEEAHRRGLRPVLAGRDAAKLAPLAGELGLEHRVAALDERAGLDAMLRGMRVVLHCAGPFAHTAGPMVEACLRAGVHYLDITGEIAVFEALARRDGEARERGVLLLPGVGFDVVPSDCLAAHLARRLPAATHLTLAFHSTGSVSRGTSITAAENLGRGGAVRRNGKIVRVPAGWRRREFDFGDGVHAVGVTIPWGDVATAWHSTGIPNIEVYMAMPRGMRRALALSRGFGWLLRRGALRRMLVAAARARAPGPDAARRARSRSRFRAEVRDAAGRHAAAVLVTPDGYSLTARTAIAAARRALEPGSPTGFQTPSLAFGPDFILEQEGVRRVDLH